MKRLLTVGAALLALAACKQTGGGDTSGGGQVAPPARKAGLWEQTILANGAPRGPTIRMCYDAGVDQKRPVFGRQSRRGACEKYSITKAADGSYVSDTICQMGSGAKITSHTVISGDFSSKYVVKSDRVVEGSPSSAINGHEVILVTATFIGPCPSGMTPGQVEIDGQVRDAPRRRGGGGESGGNQAQ